MTIKLSLSLDPIENINLEKKNDKSTLNSSSVDSSINTITDVNNQLSSIVGTDTENNSTRRSSSIPSNNNLFEENDPKFYIFTLIHCRKAAITAALIGLFGTFAVFGICICYFRWYYYEIGVDVIALTGFSVFLISGTFVHLFLLKAINKYKAAFVMPFIIFHAFLLLMENIMALTAIGQLVSDQDANMDESDLLARQILLGSPICIFLQSLMLYSGIKYRKYLKLKNMFGEIRPVWISRNVITPTIIDYDKH